ncbi:MAG: c-type cytochrome [Gemmatimonadota bacterium]
MFRRVMVGFGVVVAATVLLVGGVYALADRDFNRRYDVEPAALATHAETDADRVQRGEHLARIRGCGDCHADDGGGSAFFDDPMIGRLWASNLTSGEGGIAGAYTDRDWDRAVRHGIGPDDRPLLFMPSHEYWLLSDDDLAAIIAHYRSAPPVNRLPRDARIGPLGRVLHLTGQLPLVPAALIEHGAPRPPAPAPGPTTEYGRYLASGCTGCHGPGLSGGKIPGGDPAWPPARNITPDEATGIGGWSQADLARALREGVRPDGSAIDPSMPVSASRHMTDTEIAALYAYLMSVEPRPYGGR